MEIGMNIRAIRQKKGISIGQLCEGTGLSQGFMSLVENNKTSPSLATLETIAQFLNVPVAYFLLKQEERMKVVRKEDRSSSMFRGKHKVEHLGDFAGLRLYLMEIPPGLPSEEDVNVHEGIETHYVLKGKIVAMQGEDRYELGEGDTFSWHASVPHLARNIGEESALLLIASYSDGHRFKSK